MPRPSFSTNAYPRINLPLPVNSISRKSLFLLYLLASNAPWVGIETDLELQPIVAQYSTGESKAMSSLVANTERESSKIGKACPLVSLIGEKPRRNYRIRGVILNELNRLKRELDHSPA
jgi:hypothetical protein